MRPWLKRAAGGTLGLVGLAALSLPDLRAEIYFEGGFVYPTPPGSRAPGYAPRYAPPPPMRILFTPYTSAYPATTYGHPGAANGSRFYPYRSYYRGVEPGTATTTPALVGGPAYGIPAADFPWNQVGFEGYDESESAPGDAPVRPAEKYSLEASTLPYRVRAEYGSVVVLVAHLPEDAALWVEGVPTGAKGRTRYFESPPLPPGKEYRYAVKAAWREDGRWVTQTREVLVRAGEVHALYLTASPATLAGRQRGPGRGRPGQAQPRGPEGGGAAERLHGSARLPARGTRGPG
jgi:uncharacterized protein (TIGR03000 family)